MATIAQRPVRLTAGIVATVLVAGGGAVVLAAAPVGAAAVPTRSPGAAAATQPCEVRYTHAEDQEITVGAADDHTAINVPDGGTIKDVDVQVNVLHPNDHEVTLTLFHGAVDVTLVNAAGGTGDNFTHTILDDEAATAVAAGAAPFAGRYRPIDLLGSFDGGSAAGEWQMLAKDESTGPGTLDYWRLIITFTACDLDEDGVDDYADQCLGLAGAAPSGCPVVERELTLRWGSGRWAGRLSADADGCSAGRTVRVFKVVPGPDRRVATATTVGDGSWRRAATRPRGRHYATSPRVLVPGAGICAAVRTVAKSF